MHIRHNVSLVDKNWFQTGGNARYFAEPQTAQESADVLQFAVDRHLPIFLLGNGANILISDEGFNGLVIRPQFTHITHSIGDKKAYVTAGAGVGLSTLIDYCLGHRLVGLEEFSGIPGTIGGAVYINLHYFEFLLSHFLVHATVADMKSGTIEQVSNDWFAFGYNWSRLHEKKHVLIDATFSVQQSSESATAYAQGRRAEIVRHRSKRYPQQGTCGSFFRNFYENEVALEVGGKKIIWVAYYLDKIGIKGELSVGNAVVSHQHANMIVNSGRATSRDIITLARSMQKRVYDAFGILPQPECQLIGFSPYPLLQENDV